MQVEVSPGVYPDQSRAGALLWHSAKVRYLCSCSGRREEGRGRGNGREGEEEGGGKGRGRIGVRRGRRERGSEVK